MGASAQGMLNDPSSRLQAAAAHCKAWVLSSFSGFGCTSGEGIQIHCPEVPSLRDFSIESRGERERELCDLG